MNKRKLCLYLIDMAMILDVMVILAAFLPNIGSVKLVGSDLVLKIVLLAVFLLIARGCFRMYSSVWRYANVKLYLLLMLADCVGCGAFLLAGQVWPVINPGFAFTVISTCLIILVTLTSRFAYQILHAWLNSKKELPADAKKINVAIVGAGNVGAVLADELLRNPRSGYYPYCFIDKDMGKVGNKIRGIHIYGEDEHIVQRLKTMPVQQIVIAIPDLDTQAKWELYERYRATGCPVKLYDYLGKNDGPSKKPVLREFDIEDLLFRDSIVLDKAKCSASYGGKTVLITGGGGSIGSELCRQIAEFHPKKLIILDIYENNAYNVQQELLRKHPNLDLDVVIGSVRDKARMDDLFAIYRPEVVFHAAAHKHVPLMEKSPMEAVKNNVFGTKNVADVAEKYGVKKFILISSDKAVNPTNIMGATKRLCEMIVQSRIGSATEFMAVRFGNVLGSSGSVVPLFKQQIASGGPITLTDKRIIRYFMTIPEAVGLVMETGALAKGGELFVLNMGKPVRILELAEKLIQLSGLTPYEDIDIVEVGLRPGEKLYEELLIKNEEMDTTENEMIFIERDKALSREEIDQKLDILCRAIEQGDVLPAIRETVPTFKPPKEFHAPMLNSRPKSGAQQRSEACAPC